MRLACRYSATLFLLQGRIKGEILFRWIIWRTVPVYIHLTPRMRHQKVLKRARNNIFFHLPHQNCHAEKKRKNIASIIQHERNRERCVCVCVLCSRGFRISYLDIERVSFPPRTIVAVTEEDKKEKGSRVRSGWERVRIPPPPSSCRRYTSCTYATAAALYGRKGVSCMRAARRAAYR